MAEKGKKETATDILEEIRAVDKMVKRALLFKVLSHLKYISRKMLRYKELVRAELKEMGVSEDDSKRIIDFINESADVKLTEDDLKSIRKDARDSIQEKKKEIEKGMEKNDVPFYSTPNIPSGIQMGKLSGDYYYNQTDNIYYTSTASGDTVIKDPSGGEISVKL